VIFSSLTFFIFFALVLGLLRLLRTEIQKRWMLLAASYVFYGWWDWRFLSLIIASSAWSYYFGRRIAGSDDQRARKRFLIAAVTCDLSLLAFFKYADFFIGSFAAAFGVENPSLLRILLPVGISFFTFQSMSYTIDIYRRRIELCRSPLDFFLFVGFFPQLVAGPIVRAAEFLPQLENPVALKRDNVVLGFQVFLLGLIQKVVFADNVAVFVDPVFAEPAMYDAATLWLAMAAYGVQIFCDFSGYSLMAIGVALVMGFHLPENFRAPYISRSITEFWRRWHISLSFWLRDYLYISLGGNRRGKVRTDVNLMLTMLLGGLWHGAGWNFVLWGFLHGAALIAHKHWSRRTRLEERLDGTSRTAYGLLAWAVTLLFALLCWVPFRAADFPTTMTYLAGLFSAQGSVHWLHVGTLYLVGIMFVWHVMNVVPNRIISVVPSKTPLRWAPLWTLAFLILAAMMFAPTGASPFIYFQF